VALISLENVEKTFVVRTKAGRLRRNRTVVRAVDDVSFSVDAGSTLGYIGPNGECWIIPNMPDQDIRARRYPAAGQLVSLS